MATQTRDSPDRGGQEQEMRSIESQRSFVWERCLAEYSLSLFFRLAVDSRNSERIRFQKTYWPVVLACSESLMRFVDLKLQQVGGQMAGQRESNSFPESK